MMENCEIRLGLISAVVREQKETRGKLERLRIQLESKREALERPKKARRRKICRIELERVCLGLERLSSGGSNL